MLRAVNVAFQMKDKTAKEFNKFLSENKLNAGSWIEDDQAKERVSILMIASSLGRFDIVNELLQSNDSKNKQEWINLRTSGFIRNYAADSILEIGDVNHKTALMLAVENGHLEVVNALIAAGADLNVRNSRGNTALIESLKNYALSQNRDISRNLLQLRQQHSHIMGNAKKYLDIANALIQARADVKLKNSMNKTALTYAILSGSKIISGYGDIEKYKDFPLEDDFLCIKALLDAGATLSRATSENAVFIRLGGYAIDPDYGQGIARATFNAMHCVLKLINVMYTVDQKEAILNKCDVGTLTCENLNTFLHFTQLELTAENIDTIQNSLYYMKLTEENKKALLGITVGDKLKLLKIVFSKMLKDDIYRFFKLDKDSLQHTELYSQLQKKYPVEVIKEIFNNIGFKTLVRKGLKNKSSFASEIINNTVLTDNIKNLLLDCALESMKSSTVLDKDATTVVVLFLQKDIACRDTKYLNKINDEIGTINNVLALKELLKQLRINKFDNQYIIKKIISQIIKVECNVDLPSNITEFKEGLGHKWLLKKTMHELLKIIPECAYKGEFMLLYKSMSNALDKPEYYTPVRTNIFEKIKYIGQKLQGGIKAATVKAVALVKKNNPPSSNTGV